MDKETQDRRWAAMVESWRGDPAFRSRMEEDPKAALAESGLDLPGSVEEVRLAVDSADTVHVVVPPVPNRSVPDEALRRVVGGAGGHNVVLLSGDAVFPRSSGNWWENYNWGGYLSAG